MKKRQQLLLELLEHRKAQVQKHRDSFEYGEWSCGQQDADAEEAEYYDRTMSDTIKYVTDAGFADTLNEGKMLEVHALLKDVIDDFKQSAEHYYGVM